MLSSCNAAVSATMQSPGFVSSECAVIGTPMLPSTNVCFPAALKSSPVRAVVVVFPFVPLMQTNFVPRSQHL